MLALCLHILGLLYYLIILHPEKRVFIVELLLADEKMPEAWRENYNKPLNECGSAQIWKTQVLTSLPVNSVSNLYSLHVN